MTTKPIFFVSRDQSKARVNESSQGNSTRAEFDENLELEFKSFLAEKHTNPSDLLDEMSSQLKQEYNQIKLKEVFNN